MDWVGGNAKVDPLTGNAKRCVNWAYRFDAAIQSGSGRYAVIFERFGTKAVLIGEGKFLRELNRSFYCANAYEYPIAFLVNSKGEELIAHCPDEYNRVELEDPQTGQRVAASGEREPSDLFYSRLSASPGGRWLMSAGWVWHPIDVLSIWPAAAALANPGVIDGPGVRIEVDSDVNEAVFIDDSRVLLCANPGVEAFEGTSEGLGPGCIGVLNLDLLKYESIARVPEPVGRVMWLGDGLAVGFYGHPKVIEVATGRVVHQWNDIDSGERSGCICGHLEKQPHLALDPMNRRFAVATEKQLDIVEFNR